MKICPRCQHRYADDTMKFCRTDGATLIELEDQPTEILRPAASSHDLDTRTLNQPSQPLRRTRTTADLKPETKYAKSGDINIAYQVLGDGPVDVIYVTGWVSHLEYGWEEPSLARYYRRLASFSRLILFDKRGTGLSDQSTNMPTLEQRMDDVRAVMEAVHSERAVVIGMSEGGNMAMLFAATYPERAIALITIGAFAKRIYDPEYPWAPTPEQRQKFYDEIEHEWGGPIGVEDVAPTKANDEAFRRWWATYQRRSASPRAALVLAKLNTSIDVRHVLPAITVPTLILHRVRDRDSKIEEARFIASRIPNATLVELEGDDHLPFVGDQDAILDQVESFIGNVRGRGQIDTVLATVLTVIISGDESASFHRIAKREAEWFKGRVAQPVGTDFSATFDGPIRAIRCARAIREAAAELKINVKAGLHTGVCEIRGEAIGGKAVEMSSQLAAEAGAGEILLTNTVTDLVSGSDIVVTGKRPHRISATATECVVYALA